jgi:hypothetical protein
MNKKSFILEVAIKCYSARMAIYETPNDQTRKHVAERAFQDAEAFLEFAKESDYMS